MPPAERASKSGIVNVVLGAGLLRDLDAWLSEHGGPGGRSAAIAQAVGEWLGRQRRAKMAAAREVHDELPSMGEVRGSGESEAVPEPGQRRPPRKIRTISAGPRRGRPVFKG